MILIFHQYYYSPLCKILKSYTSATCLTLHRSGDFQNNSENLMVSTASCCLSQRYQPFHFIQFYNAHYQPLDFSLHRLPQSLPTKRFSSLTVSCPTDLSAQQRKTLNKGTLNPSNNHLFSHCREQRKVTYATFILLLISRSHFSHIALSQGDFIIQAYIQCV